jgi:ADP-ribose pyrophosphatase
MDQSLPSIVTGSPNRTVLEVVRDVIRHPGGAGALPLFADGRVALVRQYRHPARAELLEIPAGRIEPGEDPRTLRRPRG